MQNLPTLKEYGQYIQKIITYFLYKSMLMDDPHKNIMHMYVSF